MKAKLLHLKPNETVIFRQDLIHQGMGYEKSNVRFFVNIDMAGVKRDENGTSPVSLTYDQLISELDLEEKAYVNENSLNNFVKKNNCFIVLFLYVIFICNFIFFFILNKNLKTK